MITQSILEKVAKLSKIGLTQDESSRMTTEIETIIRYFEQIRNLNLENVAPMTHAVSIILNPRPDEIHPSKDTIDLMPYLKRNYFYVPAILLREERDVRNEEISTKYQMPSLAWRQARVPNKFKCPELNSGS